jgi:hypothetical protein
MNADIRASSGCTNNLLKLSQMIELITACFSGRSFSTLGFSGRHILAEMHIQSALVQNEPSEGA